MRKLVTAGVVAAAALSWAHVARAEDAAEKRKEAARATQQEMKQDMNRATQHSRDMMSDHANKGDAKRKSPFEGKDNFDVKGKLSKVSQHGVTIARDGLPAATLQISHDTKIEVGGEKATAAQLREGEEVKASFNLEGDKPVAVEIKADKPKDPGEKATR